MIRHDPVELPDVFWKEAEEVDGPAAEGLESEQLENMDEIRPDWDFDG